MTSSHPYKKCPDNARILRNSKILTDEVERSFHVDPGHFDFNNYAKALASTIRDSISNYSIGIYGEWGSGKTTLMTLIDKELKPLVFRWEDIALNSQVSNELRDWIRTKHGANWIQPHHNFEKIPGKELIELKDEASNYLSISFDQDYKKAVLKINNEEKSEFLIEAEDNGITLREDSLIVTVWFNAWRYESEESFALIPLMKTIAYTIGGYPQYSSLRDKILRGLAILGKDVLRNYAIKYLVTEKGFQELEDHISHKFAQSAEFDKNLIYFDGMKKIQDEMRNILSKSQNEARIVVFIDDLDRCSPENALEVFESLKVFLDIEGFVFVLGLSHEALYKLIEAKFQKLGVTGITGEQYIRKIIQIEVQIPKWTPDALNRLVTKALEDKLDSSLSSDCKNEIIRIVQMAVEPNPREVKRFLNRLIVALLGNPNIDLTQYLVIEALRRKWKKVYNYYFDESYGQEFRGWFYDKLLGDQEIDKDAAKEKLLSKLLNAPSELSSSDTSSSDSGSVKGSSSFVRALIDLRSELLEDTLWDLLWDYKDVFRKDDQSELKLKSTKEISELSDIFIATPPPTTDADLRSKRQESYIDLWSRFKLLFDDFQVSHVQYRGRDYIKSFRDIRKFSERLQTWYYDGGGGLLMTEATRYSFTRILERIRLMLANKAQESEEENKPIDRKEIARIRKMVQELQYNMLKDIRLT